MEALLLIWVIVITSVISLASIGLVVAIMLQFKAVSTSEKAGLPKYEYPKYNISRAVRKDGFSYIRASYRTSQEKHFLITEAMKFGPCYNDERNREISLRPLSGYDKDEVVNELRRVLKKYDEINNIPS